MPEQAGDLLLRCTPRLITVDASCGCTLTRASITAMTESDFIAQGNMETGMDKIIAQAKELRTIGVRESALKDLVLSRFTPKARSKQGSIIAPFDLLPQRSLVNRNYWVVQSGKVHPLAGVGSVPASAWQLTIINTSSPWASPLVDLEKYFLPGKYITVLYPDAVTGQAYNVLFKVLTSVNADAGGVEKALVSVQPNYTDVGWGALNAGEKAVFQPTTGIVVNLCNSVSEYESWCHQYPAENTRKLRDFWWQTVRSTWCYNDEYLKALAAPLTSAYFKQFRTLPLAEQRRIAGEQEDRDLLNTILYGQRIDENQTVNGYTNLPQVVDPNNTDCLIEYKANTLGLSTQILECGGGVDFQGGVMDVDQLKDLWYTLARVRDTEDLDIITDRGTYASLVSVLNEYFSDKYSTMTAQFIHPGQQITYNGAMLWNYTKYEFPEDGYSINLIRDRFFDDRIAAAPAALKSIMRTMIMIDWSDIWVGLADVKSVNRQTNVADDLFNCVVTPIANHYQLQSKAIQVGLGDPARHLIIGNYSDACPTPPSAPCEPAS